MQRMSRQDPVLMAMVGLMAALRLVAVFGLHPRLLPDSPEYEVLDFTGAGRRPWTVPLLFRLVHSDELRVVVHALLGAACWGALAVVAAGSVKSRPVRLTVAGAILALGLTTSVTNWDTTILSEPLLLSLTALLVAAWLAFVRQPTTIRALYVLGAMMLFAFIRQTHVVLLIFVAAASLVAAIKARARAPWMILGLGLIVLTAWSVVYYSRNGEIRKHNVTMVVAGRVWPAPNRLDWFRREGMPIPRGARPGDEVDPDVLESDPEFARWLDDEGVRTYATYLATHPGYTIRPLTELFSVRHPQDRRVVMLSTAGAYGSSRAVLPDPVEALLFDPGQTGGILLGLSALVPLMMWRRGRLGLDRRWFVPASILILSIPFAVVIWHGTTGELGRLAISLGVSVRIALILLYAALVDDLVEHRAGRQLPPSVSTTGG